MSTEISAAAGHAPATPSGRQRLNSFLSNNGALVGLVLVSLVMFAASADFLTTQNLLNVGVQAAVTAILAGLLTERSRAKASVKIARRTA